jgi:hypothetical protein
MQIFAKRFWGFDPERWPIIAFRLEGNRDSLVRESRPGDRVLFIGTNTEDTDPAERGRLLGCAEIGRTAIDSVDVLDVPSLKASAFDERGALRWPKALPMLRAWRFLLPPLVTDVLHDQLSYEATVRAVLLDADDTAAVLAIPSEEVPIVDAPAIIRQRELQAALQAAATTGPRPSTWIGETGRDAEEASFTYAFRFGERDLWKIGHAKDVIARLADVNRHVPSEVLGEQWHGGLQQPWPTEGSAYDMEQRVLAALRTPSCVGERVSCSKKRLESAWVAALTTER